jgi:hypothetical protein
MVEIYQTMQSLLPAVVYSTFVHQHGTMTFAEYLETRKCIDKPDYKYWTKYDIENHPEFFIENYDPTKADKTINPLTNKNPKYAIISGDVKLEMRIAIQNAYNHGNIIHCLLISSSGAEGLDLKKTSSVHIMESAWNDARNQQVIARAVRYLSHEGLPKNLRVVSPHIYLSVVPKNIKTKNLTTDQELFKRARHEKQRIDIFAMALVEASVDCTTHVKLNSPLAKTIHCLRCKPTGKQLFPKDIQTHMKEPSQCVEPKGYGKKITAKEIIVDNVKLFYTKDKDNITVYEHSSAMDGWVPMAFDNPLYPVILTHINHNV